MAANLSGGGFSFYFQTPEYQVGAVLQYLELYRELYDGFYKCARCRDLTFSYFLIHAALTAVATPTSPRKRSITI